MPATEERKAGTAIADPLDQPLIRRELQRVVAMLSTRFPECGQVDLEWLVTDVHQRLWRDARIRAHLIPLTVNRCRRILSDRRRGREKGIGVAE